MTKYLDDSTFATMPGKLMVSEAKLRELEPGLFTARTYKCCATCDVDHPAADMREKLGEHLEHGCCCAAVVMSVEPLIVAAYADDLDGVVLLRFPSRYAARYGLEVGSQLLSINLYQEVKAKNGARLYAVDIVPGPGRKAWSSFSPLIAELVSDDAARIAEIKATMPAQDWLTCATRARAHIDRLGIEHARSGEPMAAGFPVRRSGREYFAPRGALSTLASGAPAPAVPAATGSRTTAIAAAVAVGVLLVVLYQIAAG
jgi:hypothetical protein